MNVAKPLELAQPSFVKPFLERHAVTLSQQSALLPFPLLAVHHLYFTVVDSWHEPLEGALWLALAVVAIWALRSHARTAARAAHVAFAAIVLGSAVAVNFGVAQPIASVWVGPLEVRQAEVFGLIPSLQAVALLAGVPIQRNRTARYGVSAVIVALASVTGWLGVPIALYGIRGLPISALVYLVCVPIGGDIAPKVTTRMVAEVQAARPIASAAPTFDHPWPFWMADLTSGALLAYALLRRDRSLALVAVSGFRYGSVLWFTPVAAAVLVFGKQRNTSPDRCFVSSSMASV